MIERCYRDLTLVIDEVHALFDEWVEQEQFSAVVDEFGLLVMKLAVHEWIANLVQHADFRGTPPMIRLCIEPEGHGLHCEIEDNSAGFDFREHLTQQRAAVHNPEPSERGRGLLMLIACTENLSYETASHGVQRLAFVIRTPVAPESLAPLFPSADQL
ncbi:MAG: ATP-binding protein [Rhodothermaceae bacterium]|nr:ATP-binding protein [Rhodothermaceae bacterium]